MHKNKDYIAYLYAQEKTLGNKRLKEGKYPVDIDAVSYTHLTLPTIYSV